MSKVTKLGAQILFITVAMSLMGACTKASIDAPQAAIDVVINDIKANECGSVECKDFKIVFAGSQELIEADIANNIPERYHIGVDFKIKNNGKWSDDYKCKVIILYYGSYTTLDWLDSSGPSLKKKRICHLPL